MKVRTLEKKAERVSFSDLDSGCCFRFEENAHDVCMRTAGCIYVLIREGVIRAGDPDALVIPVNGTFVEEAQ